MTRKQEKKEMAIPEPIIIKREMLESCYEAGFSLSKYLKNKKYNREQFERFKIWVRDLFFKLEMKIDFKRKNYKVLKKLQEFIYNGTSMDYKEWIDCFYALRFKLEDMGVTKIEMGEEDIYTILKRP